MLFCRFDITVDLKLKTFVSQLIILSIIVSLPLCTARCVLSCDGITYFISASVTVGRRFNAASKKENNAEEMFIHFLIKNFLENDPLRFDS